MLGQRFHSMFSSLGWTSADVAKFLRVSGRTVQLWISGRVRVPYAAYKLLRLQLRYELPGDAWNGWTISAGRLYTPEGYELRPQDFNWWSLLVRRAALFHELYTENARLTQQMKAGRMLPGTAGTGKRSAGPAGRGCTAPTSAAGRPAQPAGLDLSIEHFGTRKSKNECLRGFQRVSVKGASDGYSRSA